MTSMTQDDELRGLSRRERQIMDLLFQRGKASVGEVMDGIPDPPGYSAVRATLRTLEQKGRVTHEEDGRAYIYRPTLRRDAARKSALTHVLKTFFDNSAEQAVAALLELKGPRLSDAQLDRVSRLIENAKKEGR
ncbi:MAG TPA: BlaI/MecI/CopY family transcriptional regulator [Gemmatimonadaceae bacterium]|jgi:BlaI family transcriptional regulator, penicillinase repressor|nr:BlaI/MecI/CopY family transcriptional regulator [Gemmatimonadaceae bacterium]